MLVLVFPLVCTYQVPETFSKENLTSFLDTNAESLRDVRWCIIEIEG